MRHAPRILIVLLVVVVGAAVRVIGIDHGAPRLLFHPDVPKQARTARAMYLGQFKLDAGNRDEFERTIYPYGTASVVASIARCLAPPGEHAAEMSRRNAWFWARAMRDLAAALALLSAAAVLLSCYPVFGAPVSAVIGLLLVLEPYNAQFSHYAMNDVPLAALLLLGWLCAGRMVRARGALPVWSLAAGLCLGIGFGVKYQALLGFLFPAAAWLLLYGRAGRLRLLGSAAAVLAGWAAGVAWTCPLLVSEPAYFLTRFPQFLHWQSHILALDEPRFVTVRRNALWLICFFARSGFWLMVPGTVWAAQYALRPVGDAWRRVLTGAAAMFVAAMILTLVLGRETMRAMDLLTVFPFMTVLTGFWLGALLHGPTRGRSLFARAALCGGGILAGVFGVNAFLDSAALSREDTRYRARAWCLENIPAGAVVQIEHYVLPIAKEGVTEWRYRFLADPPAAKRIFAQEPDYVIASSLVYDRFYARYQPWFNEDRQAVYAHLASQYNCAATFRDRKLLFAHPAITVYRKPQPDPPQAP